MGFKTEVNQTRDLRLPWEPPNNFDLYVSKRRDEVSSIGVQSNLFILAFSNIQVFVKSSEVFRRGPCTLLNKDQRRPSNYVQVPICGPY